MSERQRLRLTVNGTTYEREGEPRLLLVDLLRDELGLTGTHVGCEHGVCGACTIRLDGTLARACLMFAVQADGRRIDTAKGLAGTDGAQRDLQQAFRPHHALQCGFCTPGILISVERFLEHSPAPNAEQVRDMLSGHICRCTGYVGIVNAILDVAAERAAGEPKNTR